MQYITTGNRIAVENFTIGDLYTITFESGTYINCACIGIGANFVTFQRNLPELLFTLTMETAELVSSIELYAGGTGTNNYNELQNKPEINDVELVGNKSLSDLGIQAEITEESPLSSALVSGLGSAAAAESSDFATAAQGALAASAVQPAALDAALALKQDTLSTAQLAAVNSGITSAAVTQIETNKNNILSLTADIANAPTKLIIQPSGAATSSYSFDWTELPASTYMLFVRNVIDGTRYGASLYILVRYSSGDYGFSPVMEITNAKITNFSVSSGTATMTFDANGSHSINAIKTM